MVRAIGLDIVEIDRIANNLGRFGERFVRRILGSEERSIFDRRADQAIFLAGRFACKEAVIKVLGFRLSRRPPLGQLQILNDSLGQPVLVLPAEISGKLAGTRCLVSITHEKKYAAAVAILDSP